jgi:hypothetical protein
MMRKVVRDLKQTVSGVLRADQDCSWLEQSRGCPSSLPQPYCGIHRTGMI